MYAWRAGMCVAICLRFQAKSKLFSFIICPWVTYLDLSAGRFSWLLLAAFSQARLSALIFQNDLSAVVYLHASICIYPSLPFPLGPPPAPQLLSQLEAEAAGRLKAHEALTEKQAEWEQQQAEMQEGFKAVDARWKAKVGAR